MEERIKEKILEEIESSLEILSRSEGYEKSLKETEIIKNLSVAYANLK